MDIPFDRTPPSGTGIMVAVAPLLRRIIAPNPGPFTFTGTCSYVIGRGAVSVVDPGPADDGHILALLAGLDKGERVAHILVTHTHKDHSPGARLLAERTGAPILGCAPHHAARDLRAGEANLLDASNDDAHTPARILVHGERVEGDDHALITLATPGHTANHLAFVLETEGGADMVLTGDHVMAWSTSIIAPPDGAMGAYLAALETLLERGEDRAFWPGHGGPVVEPRRFTRALLHHRRQREVQVLDCLSHGSALIADLVEACYIGLNPALKGAAALSLFAHLEDLVARGLVMAEGEVTLEARYMRV
jgi:glyoxylase-like metal-dependent hydrolase (beta-lactamase superfamily II)